MHSFAFNEKEGVLVIEGVTKTQALGLINQMAGVEGVPAPEDPLEAATRPGGTPVSKTQRDLEDAVEEAGGEVVQTPVGPVIVNDGQPDTEEANPTQSSNEAIRAQLQKMLKKRKWKGFKITEKVANEAEGTVTYTFAGGHAVVKADGTVVHEVLTTDQDEEETKAPAPESTPEPEVEAAPEPAAEESDDDELDAETKGKIAEATTLKGVVVALLDVRYPPSKIPALCMKLKPGHKVLQRASDLEGRVGRVLATLGAL